MKKCLKWQLNLLKNYLYEEFGYEVDESWMKDGALSDDDEEGTGEE